MNSKIEILPWETIDEKELLNSPWLKITQESCKLPQGKIITDFYTIWQPDWVLILPRTVNGNWIMTKQYRHGTGKVSLEFPAGIIEKGESPLQAAKREMEEEVSFSGGNFYSIGEFPMNPDRHRGRFFVFFADAVESGGSLKPDETEEISVLEISTELLEEKIQSGEMNHPLQIAAYFKYKLNFK